MADKPIARVGDMHVCPAHGANAIVTGASSVLVNGKPVARVGDKTACGAGILTGAVSFFGQGSMVAYMGSTTSHGGLITTGSPDTFVGVEIVAVDNIAVHRTAGSEINDPPLEGVPILPVEELAQVVKEIVETLQEQELSFAVVGSVAADVVLRKVEKVIPVKQIKKEIEAFGERALAKYKALTGKATHPDFNRRYHGPDDLLKNKNNRLEEVEVKATKNPASKPVPKENTAGKQGSAANNKQRGAKMKGKQPRVNKPSNRIGGVYTQEEIDLWKEIRNQGGGKQHTFIRANQSTNKAEVFPQDKDGILGEKLFEFDVD